MNETIEKAKKYLFKDEWTRLTPEERDVIEGILYRIDPLRDPNKEFSDHRTFGERTSDAIAKFGGSWTFICLFGCSLLLWAFTNTEILGPRNEAFDPYPYVFLNLILSMLAAIQAPIIMMSQIRQNTKDRLDAEIDHEVNVRAEIAIHHLHDRIHGLENQLADVISLIQGTARPIGQADVKHDQHP